MSHFVTMTFSWPFAQVKAAHCTDQQELEVYPLCLVIEGKADNSKVRCLNKQESEATKVQTHTTLFR